MWRVTQELGQSRHSHWQSRACSIPGRPDRHEQAGELGRLGVARWRVHGGCQRSCHEVVPACAEQRQHRLKNTH